MSAPSSAYCNGNLSILTPRLLILTLARSWFLLFRLFQILGGKGGFGSQLRAAGGRMSSQRLAAAIAAEPERQLAKRRKQKRVRRLRRRSKTRHSLWEDEQT
ncbi:hypothetical protein H4Q26_015960 [Puccinia striiformis f. sp. tritici PST-130]|nr:hypothetical protein H4Q26_015960 [Puccinia striiformis f. sp. tritici PST-130]